MTKTGVASSSSLSGIESAGAARIAGGQMLRMASATAWRDDTGDAALASAARAGDRQAFARLHERFAGMVHEPHKGEHHPLYQTTPQNPIEGRYGGGFVLLRR